MSGDKKRGRSDYLSLPPLIFKVSLIHSRVVNPANAGQKRAARLTPTGGLQGERSESSWKIMHLDAGTDLG